MRKRSPNRKQRPRGLISRKLSPDRASSSPLSVAFKVATRPVYSLHDATLALIDLAIETLRSNRNDEAVHRVRKHCKRVRASLRLLHGCIGKAAYQAHNEGVRDAAKPLTALRDAFMLRKTLETLPQRAIALQRELDLGYRRERQAFIHGGANRALKLLADVRTRLETLPSTKSELASALAGIKKTYKVGRRAFKMARGLDDALLHEWRKQTKYLLNQLQLLKTVFNAKTKHLQREAHDVADALGDDHNLAVLMTRLQNDRSSLNELKKRRRRLQQQAFRKGEKLYRRSATKLETMIASRLS